MSGFYLMHRDWQENAIFGNEEYSSRDAWVWLVEHAAWKPTRTRIKGEVVDLERGELCFAQRFMAEKWGWSKSRVDRFLKRLADENMISIRSKIGATAGQGSGQGQSIITICNYAQYQDTQDVQRGNDKTQIGATAGQQRGKEEQGNKETREQDTSEAKASSVSRPRKVDDFPMLDCTDPGTWDDFLKNRRKKRLPNTGSAHRKLVTDLSEMSARTGWPPGDVFRACVERGWGAIYDPRTDENHGRSRQNREQEIADPLVRAVFRNEAMRAAGSP